MMKVLTTLALALLALCLPGNISATQDTLRTDSVHVDSVQQAAAVVTDTVKTALVPPFQVPSEGLSLMSISRGMLGILICVIILFLFSNNRAKINWKLVISGIALQLVLGILVLKVPFVKNVFEYLANAFAKLIGFADSGVAFLFGSFASGQTIVEQPLVNFAIKILPTVIFFSALTSVLFYFGILQKVVYALAWALKKIMRLSGAEALAASGNIFLGQTEAPLLVRPYIEKMTRSEIMCLMTGGMATIAGGVLAAYIGFLGGGDKVQQTFYAMHLLTASVMSAPAAIVAAKILVPETEPFIEDLQVSKERIGSNFLEAISNGTTDGLKLAVNVGAMLLVFTALVTLVNALLDDGLGSITGLNAKITSVTNGRYNGLNLQFILGCICSPIAWLLGVPTADMMAVGQLLGEKTAINEFYAYTQMGKMKNTGVFVYEKSLVMSTYILCGFSNFASIGIQIGGIGSLAPSKKALLSELGFRAMLGGTIACLLTAAIAGMFY